MHEHHVTCFVVTGEGHLLSKMGALERLLMGQTAVGDAWALQRANIKNAGKEGQALLHSVGEAAQLYRL